MNFSKIEISGFRGFAEKGELNFAVPNNNAGSGLTIVVGANNSGKSTIFEAIRAVSQNQAPSIIEEQRNIKTGTKVEITLWDTEDKAIRLSTIAAGGSETEYNYPDNYDVQDFQNSIFTLQSRRAFNPAFEKIELTLNDYRLNAQTIRKTRPNSNDFFTSRLFAIIKDKEKHEKFNTEFSKVIGKEIQWTIDENAAGHYIKFFFGNTTHNSDGVGDGIISLFAIVDSLYDSNEESMVVIDEPELSLHPAYQKRLMDLIVEYAKNRQIVVFTHSPYFIDWNALFNGGKLYRTVRDDDGIRIFGLSETTLDNANLN